MRFAFDGHELDYEVRGEGRTLAFLHGLTVDRRILIESCEPVLAGSRWRRLYLDLPGHGASKGNREAASADRLVYALSAFIGEVAGPSPCLVAYSYGAYLAQGLVGALSDLGGLFLACPIVEADFGKRVVPRQRVAVREDGLVFADDTERAAFTGEAVLQTHAQLAMFQRVIQPAHLTCDRDFLAVTRSNYVMSRMYMQSLAEFDGPVSIVSGRDDYWAGFEDAVTLVRAFPHSQYAVLPDAGHLLPLESGPRFRLLLSDWLSRLD